MATDFVQKWAKLPTPALIAMSFRKGMGYRYINGRVNSAMMPVYRVKIS